MATLAIETGVAMLAGYRSRREMASIVLVNLITHPFLNYVLWLNKVLALAWWGTLTLGLEACAVAVEWLLLCYALRQQPAALLRLSVAMNGASFLAGILAIR